MSSTLNSVGSSNCHNRLPRRKTTDEQHLLQQALGDPIDYFLSRPGKRIRAELIEIAFRAAGGAGDLPANIIDFVELLHAGSLIIDDIQDNSLNRRQQETVHLKFGVPLGINTGNWMYFAALEKLSEVGTSPLQTLAIMKESLKVIKHCHEGQALDLTATFDRLEPSSLPRVVEQISELKTGALTGLAAMLGGVVATDDKRTLKTLSQFGRKLGMGLQMQNDFVELQKVASTGNSSDDLKNRRCTWPWAWLASAYSDAEVRRLASLCVEQLPEPQGAAQQILERIEIVAVNEINGKLEEALQVLETLGIDPAISKRMNQIITKLEFNHV